MESKYVEEVVNLSFEDLNENTNEVTLEYYIVQSDFNDEEITKEKLVYGIEILKKSNFEIVDKRTISNFSFSQKETIDTLKLLARNSVTPLTMEYVIDDLIGA